MRSSGDGDYAYEYDDKGHVAKSAYSGPGLLDPAMGYTGTYAYDDEGRISQASVGTSGEPDAFAFDDAGAALRGLVRWPPHDSCPMIQPPHDTTAPSKRTPSFFIAFRDAAHAMLFPINSDEMRPFSFRVDR